MLLRPQHFQQAFGRVDLAIEDLWRSIVPYAYGVLSMAIDAVELSAGKLVVRTLDAVLRDGSRIQIAAPAAPLELALKPSIERYQTAPQRIYAVLPLNPQASGRETRFRSVAAGEAADINTGENPVAIERLEPAAALWDEGEPPAKFASLPIAEVYYGPNGFAVSDYAPPALRTPPGSPIAQVCAELVQAIRGKVTSSARMGNLPAETRQQGALLVAALPALELLLHSGVVHPFSLYLELARMAGSLAALRETPGPVDLDRYDHLDPLPCFRRAITEIRRSLERYAPAALLNFPFTFEGNQFRLKAHPGWNSALNPTSGRQLVLGARLGADLSGDEAASWVSRAAIGLRSAMPGLQDRRELGASRKPGSPESRLRPDSGEVLFTLMPNPNSPEALAPSDDDLLVAASSLDLPRPASLTLYVMDPPAAAGAGS
jgi:type VI secretion system protein ImpJ